MSITDELREWWVRKFPIMDKELHEDFTALADRIDAEHQKALDEWKAKHGQMWLKGYSECHAELLEGNETLASDLERCGWVRRNKEHVISHATVEVTPHIDWSRMADELDEFVEIVRGMALAEGEDA